MSTKAPLLNPPLPRVNPCYLRLTVRCPECGLYGKRLQKPEKLIERFQRTKERTKNCDRARCSPFHGNCYLPGDDAALLFLFDLNTEVKTCLFVTFEALKPLSIKLDIPAEIEIKYCGAIGNPPTEGIHLVHRAGDMEEEARVWLKRTTFTLLEEGEAEDVWLFKVPDKGDMRYTFPKHYFVDKKKPDEKKDNEKKPDDKDVVVTKHVVIVDK